MNQKYQLLPSILSADFNRLGEQIHTIEQAGCEWLHIDVMDGMFVPSISFGMPVIQSIRKETSLFFDVHLMVQDPGRYVECFHECGADLLTVHAEACPDLEQTLKKIRSCGRKVGVALNPATPLSVLKGLLDQVDMILLMSVNPGFGGQKYIPETTQKIKDLRVMLKEYGREDLNVEVDGGINQETIDEALMAGANMIVAGSAVFRGDIRENIRVLESKIGSYEKESQGRKY